MAITQVERSVKSVMGAESKALLEGAEYGMLKALNKKITSIDVPLVCITDNRSLFDAVNSTTIVKDKRIYIDICAPRQIIKGGDISKLKLT